MCPLLILNLEPWEKVSFSVFRPQIGYYRDIEIIIAQVDFIFFIFLNKNNDVLLLCAHQRPERSHDTY